MPNIVDENGRWRWWYEAIADWMITHPSGKLGDCAAELGKSAGTISTIINSDLFKDYYAKRKADWRARHDESIVAKTTQIAQLGLDLILERMEAKRDAVPIGVITEVTNSALDRLGYGIKPQGPPQGPTAVSVQVVQVSAQDLAEARSLIRDREQQRLGGPLKQIPSQTGEAGARPLKVAESDEEVLHAPSS